MKELVWKNERISHQILCAASKFIFDITTKGLISWGKNDKLLSWNLQTTSKRQKKMLYCTK